MFRENPVIARAEALLAEGVPINWQSIRDELTLAQAERLSKAARPPERRTATNDDLDDLLHDE